MADKEFTYSDVSEHNTKKDLYIVVHDKVYNASSFVDEHPYVYFNFAPPTHGLGFPPSAPQNTPPFPLMVALVSDSTVTTSANKFLTAVVRKFSSMLAAKTQQRHSRMSATQTKPARFSMACWSEL